jgi:hypothetical protein
MKMRKGLKIYGSKERSPSTNSNPNSLPFRKTKRSFFTEAEPKKRALPVRQPDTSRWGIKTLKPFMVASRVGKRQDTVSLAKVVILTLLYIPCLPFDHSTSSWLRANGRRDERRIKELTTSGF